MRRSTQYVVRLIQAGISCLRKIRAKQVPQTDIPDKKKFSLLIEKVSEHHARGIHQKVLESNLQ